MISVSVSQSANSRMQELMGGQITIDDSFREELRIIGHNVATSNTFRVPFCGVNLVCVKKEQEIVIMTALTRDQSQDSLETTYEKLYKADSKGKVRVWWMEQSGGMYRTHSGIKDGNIVTSEWTVAKPKNVGKANETSEEQQAFKEVTAKYKKKREQSGYGSTLSEAKVTFIEPMLAKKFEPKRVDFDSGVLLQPKLDGIRCLTRMEDGEIVMRTRKGKEILSCPHIVRALQEVFNEDYGLELDGELYNHEYRDKFQKLVSVIRKQKPTDEQKAEAAKVVQYHIYDHVSADTTMDRTGQLVDILAETEDCIVCVPTTQINSREDSDALHSEHMAQGYEGTMYRNIAAAYEQKRSAALLKRKEFEDGEYVIIDVIEGEGNRSGMAGKVRFKIDPDGCEGEANTFAANPRGNFDFYRELLANKDGYIGKEATVRFMGLTDDGKPRHGVVVDFHDGARED